MSTVPLKTKIILSRSTLKPAITIMDVILFQIYLKSFKRGVCLHIVQVQGISCCSLQCVIRQQLCICLELVALYQMDDASEISRIMFRIIFIILSKQNQQYYKQHMMDIEEDYQHIKKNKKLRIHVTTNRNLQFITAIRPEATISQLANRALNVYLELSGESYLQNASKKQLTVSAVKQGVFYMPKSENVSNLLNQDDQVEVVIIKAKPKYPNQFYPPKAEQTKIENTTKKIDKEKVNEDQMQKDLKNFQLEKLVEKENSIVIDQKDIIKSNININVEKKIKESVITSSKRQKKKQKKKEKFDLKRKMQQEQEQKIKNQNKRREISPELSDVKQKQFMLQSLPKKKVKLDKEQNLNSSQKVIKQIVAPSPKITFHPDPKIDSPRVLLLQSQKKKNNLEGAQNKNADVQNRKFSEDAQKKNNFQKILSPLFSNKSPFLNQKNVQQSHSSFQNLKQKERQEFCNFSLRKPSEDRRVQVKRDKNKQDTSSIRSKNQSLKQMKEPTIQKESTEKSTEKIVNNSNVEGDQVAKSLQKISTIKPTKSLAIVQPSSDSQSQQKKDIHDYQFQSHRYRELAQIKNKITPFLIQSDGDE